MAVIGPTSTGGTTGSGLGSGAAFTSQFTMPAGGGTVTKLSALVNGSGTPKIYPIVYADSGDAAAALLGYDASVDVPTSGYAFLDLPIVTHTPGGIVVPAGKFWAGYVVEIGLVSYDDNATTGLFNYGAGYSTTPADPFSEAGGGSSVALLTINITYTPAGAAGFSKILAFG